MAEPRAAWGIDIGQSALKALKLRYMEEAGQAVAVAFDYVPYPKILSQPDAIPDEIIRDAMATFLSRNDVAGDLIAISVPGQSALARFIQLPPVESSKLAEIIKYEARQQIPFALEEVIWDYQPLGAGAEESGYLLDAEVGLFAMKRDQVQQQLKPFTDAKLEVELIQIAPLALYNVLAYDELGIRPDQEMPARDDYVIVLDMGCDNTALLVSNGKKIWVRNVPLGGNHFTRSLTKEMKLSFAKAEHLKCNATKSPDPRAVFQALRPVFNDYVSEIQRSVGFFSSVNRQAKISKVIGLGNGFKLAGLQKFLQQNLQYEVERPDTFRSLAGDAVLNAPLFSDNVLSFAVSYGLALQVLGRTRIRTSLLPPEIATARKIRRKKPWAVVTAASLLLGYAVSTMGNAISFAKPTSPEFAEAEKQVNDLSGKVGTDKSAYDAETGKFTATGQKLDKLIGGRRDLTWLEMYNAVLDCLPRDVGDEQDVTDITQKNMISIESFTAERKADVGEWFTKLGEQSKDKLLKEDKEKAPTGDGYIVTLELLHWHYEKDNPLRNHIQYVEDNFLRRLQQLVVEVPGYPPRDVRRMGITHATITKWSDLQLINYSPTGALGPVRRAMPGQYGGGAVGQFVAPAFAGQNFGGGVGAAAAFPGGAGGPAGQLGAEDVKQINQSACTVQFVFQPVAPDKRAPLPEPAPPAGQETGAEAAPTTPPSP
jgi:type IV pilus assembly protein PilM